MNRHLLQDTLDRCREGLVGLGFCDDGERLRGPVPWSGPGTGRVQARVEISFGPGFPFSPPRVVVLDPGAPLQATFHVEADGALCLWDDAWPVDQTPWTNAGRLVDRIADWLASAAAGWPGDESCDLERYLAHDPGTFVLYDATNLVLDAAVRTTQGPTPGSILLTSDRRKVRELGGGRRRRRDNQLAWAADIGAVTRPLRRWNDIIPVLGAHAATVTRLIHFQAIAVLLLRYTHGGAAGVLALRCRSTTAGIDVLACESADTSAATRGLRAGPAAPQLAGVRIAVVGCGAIGSFTADLLFRSGVRQLTLADGERLRPGNVVRHRAGAGHVGRLKTDAVFACLAAVAQEVSQVRTRGPVITLDDAVDLVRTHQVVLDATASARASSLLAVAADEMGRGTGHTVVSVCAQRDGQVIRVDRMPLRPTEAHLPPLPLVDGTANLREGGCGSPVSPTPPGTVLTAAELAHRVVTDEATRTCSMPATIIDVREPQPEASFQRVGPITSTTATQAGAR